jgi:hypothetical protein
MDECNKQLRIKEINEKLIYFGQLLQKKEALLDTVWVNSNVGSSQDRCREERVQKEILFFMTQIERLQIELDVLNGKRKKHPAHSSSIVVRSTTLVRVYKWSKCLFCLMIGFSFNFDPCSVRYTLFR